MKRERLTVTAAAIASAWILTACGSSTPSAGAGGTQVGSGGQSAGGSSASTTAAGAGGANAACTANGAGGASTTSGSGGSSAPSTYPNSGVCARRVKATADATSFSGYEERYLIGEAGLGSEICVVRFDLKRVGDAPPCCTACQWTDLVEYSNPTVITDTDGVCAHSDLAMDTAAIAKIDGSRVGIGFAPHYDAAHGSACMTYFDDKKMWDVTGRANWTESTKTFSYTYREGFCNYGP